MNMWAGYPCFIDYLENGFKEFLLDDSGDELTKEYLLPIIVDQLIKTNRASVKVLETTDKWFGVTYPEDKQAVQDSIKELIEKGIYPENYGNKKSSLKLDFFITLNHRYNTIIT